MTENRQWWINNILCPSCGGHLPPFGLQSETCANCGCGFQSKDNIITFHSIETDHLAQVDSSHIKDRSVAWDFVRCVARPVKLINERRIERHYKKTLTDPSTAKSWVEHYFRGLNIKAGDRILDYGCGRGRLLGFFQQMGYLAVGLDMKKNDWWGNFKDTGFIVTNPQFLRIPFCDESFDVVLNIDSTHYFNADRLEKHAKEVKRILRPNGSWIILQVNPEGYNMPLITKNWHGRFHTLSEARRTLTDIGFTEIDHWFEGMALPVSSKPFNALRHLLSPWPLNMYDYNLQINRMILSEKRHRWLLRVRKPANL